MGKESLWERLLDDARLAAAGTGRSSPSGSSSFVWVDQIAQLLGGLEVGNAFCRDFDAIAGFGIAADAGIALPDTEGAKAANLNLVSRLQGGDHGVEDGLDNHFPVA